MAKSNYEESLRRLLEHEGGYTNHPSDPGGPTNFGITIADYRRYVMTDATAADVKAMTISQAKSIYRAKYWDAQRCDDLPPGVDYTMFDYGVNSGIGRSGKVLRRILGLADATSQVTDGVISVAIKKYPADLVTAICDERLRFLQSLRTWSVFGKGWGRRVAEVKAAALVMAAGTKPAIQITGPSTGKGTIPPTTPTTKTVSTGASAGGAGVAAHQAGLPWWACIIIAILAAAAVYGAIHYFKRKD